MLLTVSTTHQPATDLGYLLAKHPDRVQVFPTTGGAAHVWYPEADAERCTGDSLDAVFRACTGADAQIGGFREVTATRRTARRLS